MLLSESSFFDLKHKCVQTGISDFNLLVVLYAKLSLVALVLLKTYDNAAIHKGCSTMNIKQFSPFV